MVIAGSEATVSCAISTTQLAGGGQHRGFDVQVCNFDADPGLREMGRERVYEHHRTVPAADTSNRHIDPVCVLVASVGEEGTYRVRQMVDESAGTRRVYHPVSDLAVEPCQFTHTRIYMRVAEQNAGVDGDGAAGRLPVAVAEAGENAFDEKRSSHTYDTTRSH